MPYIQSSISLLLLLWSYRIENNRWRTTDDLYSSSDDGDNDDDGVVVKKQAPNRTDTMSLLSLKSRRNVISFLIVLISVLSWVVNDPASSSSSLTDTLTSSLLSPWNRSLLLYDDDKSMPTFHEITYTDRPHVKSSLASDQWNHYLHYHHQNTTSMQPLHRHIHVIVLMHGWMGNPIALDYLEQTLQRQSNDDDVWVVHKAACNHWKTFDGIANGGKRLANEINNVLYDVISKELNQHGNNNSSEGTLLSSSSSRRTTTTVSLSIIGQSLGGLYGKYALSQIDWNIHEKFTNHENSEMNRIQPLVPAVFCTVTSPHLGVSQNTYLLLPRFLEYIGASVLQQTGLDLFRYSNVLDQLITNDAYTKPIKQFYHRRLYANVYDTDFLVPFRTSAVVTTATDSIHHSVVSTTAKEHNDPDARSRDQFVVLTLETKPNKRAASSPHNHTRTLSYDEMAQSIDELGWTKVLCDMRNALYSVPIRSSKNTDSYERKNDIPSTHYKSSDLITKFERNIDNRYYAPFGHGVMIANSMTQWYGYIMSSGKPMVDRIGYDVIEKILEAKQHNLHSKNSTKR